MTGEILKNEWLFLYRNKTFLGISIGFILVLFISIFLGNLETKKLAEESKIAQNHFRKQWESIEAMNPHSAAHYGTYVFKPTNLMNSLDEGVNTVTGKVLRVEGHVQNEIVYSEASQMLMASKFGKVKSALILQYIIPLLLIFLAFNAVSSEKQSGRLKLLIVQGATIKSILLEKLFSVWIYSIALLLIVISVYLLQNTSDLNSNVLIRCLSFFISYALYYFVICALTIYFSARWQSASIALTSMLGIWILWTIFIPNIVMSSVEKLHEFPSRNDFNLAMKEDRSKGLDGHNPADKRTKELEKKTLKKYNVDSLSQLPINFDGLVMQADEEYGNKVWDKHFGNLRTVYHQQKKTYQLAGVFNPFIALQNASMGFAGTDNLHHQEFLLQVEQYRRVFIKALNDKHAFGGSKTGDWGWTANNSFFKSIADFKYQERYFKNIIPSYITDLIFLLFWSFFVFFLIIVGSKKVRIS
jgi:ABC-2 type transport system permease protein